MAEKKKNELDQFHVMFKPRYETSKWLENITRGLVTEAIFRVWLDREISTKLNTNYHIINLCIFNPPHSYNPVLKNPFFNLIGDSPDFAIAHIEDLDGEYRRGLVGLYQYDRIDIIMDVKCERGFHPQSTSGICSRNCKRFKDCISNNERRGWFPESQVGQFSKFYTLLSESKPKFGFIAWFPLPMLDKITKDVVESGLIEHSYICAVIGSKFFQEDSLLKKIDAYLDWRMFNQNIRWVPLDDNGHPLFAEHYKARSERGMYYNICFNLNKAMTANQMIHFVNEMIPDVFDIVG